jgi:hypothetical protein
MMKGNDPDPLQDLDIVKKKMKQNAESIALTTASAKLIRMRQPKVPPTAGFGHQI